MTKKNRGLTIEKYFTGVESNPIDYKTSDVHILDEFGKPLFVQKGAEFPSYFSELAKRIVASRYFYGENGTSERENSL